MKRYFFFLLPLAGIAALAVVLWLAAPNHNPAGPDPELAPSERVEWELLRLRDPQTGKIPDNIRMKELAFAATLPARDINGKQPRTLSTDWAFRGPWNVGGRTRALAVDAANENILLAGGVSSGMWRSADGGTTWTKTTGNEQLQSVTCIAQDKRPGKTNVWYYGTGELWGNSADINGDGIFKSVDGGATWQPLSSTVNGTPQSWDDKFEYVWQIATDPSNLTQDEVYAVPALGGVFRSMDGGATWNAVLGSFGNSSSIFTDIAVTSTGVVYATLSEYSVGNGSATVRGIYRSADGTNWKNITPAGWPEKYKRIVIGVSPSDENQVYFLAETPDNGFAGKFVLLEETRTEWHSLWKYTYTSGDGTGAGGVWENRSANLPAFGGRTGDFISQGSYDLVIAVKPDNPNIVFIGGTNLYRSTDGFATKNNTTWIGGYAPETPLARFPAYDNHHSDQHAISFLPSNPTILLSGNDGGVQRTDNSLAETVVWTPLNNGYITTQFYTVAVDKSADKSNVVLGGAQDNGTWLTTNTNAQADWKKPWGADGAYCAVASGRTSYYISSQQGKVYRFLIDANGDTLAHTRVDPKGGTGYLFINPFTLDPNNTDRMYLAAGSVLWRNNNLTEIPLGEYDAPAVINWDSLSATRVADTISTVSVSVVPANRVYYGTIRGNIYRLDEAHTGNPTPVKITGSAFPKNSYVSCIAVDPRNADRAIAVFSNYNVQSLFYTEDGGTNWTTVSGNLEQNANGSGNGPSCRWASIVPVPGGETILVGTSVGLFSTSYLDGQWTAWRQEGKSTLGNAIVDMIDVRTADGLTAVATHGAGIYSGYVNTLVDVPPVAPVLVAPANGSASIGQSVALVWKPAAGAAYYVVEVSKDPTFATVALQQGGISDTTFTATDLEAGQVRYYWRVRSVNSGGTSVYSSVWSFETVIAAPVLLSPASGSTDVSRNVTLTWEPVPGAVSYRVQVSTSIVFGTFAAEAVGLTTTSFTVPVLEANKRYFWRVSATDASGAESPFSIRWSFTTGTMTGVKDAGQETPFALLPNYPNPVSSSTTLRFTLARRAFVELAVYDATGKKLAMPLSREMNAGEHTVPFDASTLANGRYFYRLSSGGKTQTGEMIVRK